MIYTKDKVKNDRRDDRDRYYERRGPPPPSYDRGYPDERRGGYDSYPPTNSYGKRPRPRYVILFYLILQTST